MEQVPPSNISKGQEVIEVSRRRTRRKSAPFRVGYFRSRGPIRPVTGRPSLFPTSFTPSPVSCPCGQATTKVGDVGLTQLPIEKNRDGVVGAYAPVGLIGCRWPTGEWGSPTHVPFWSRLVSLFSRFAFTELQVALHFRSTGNRPSLVRPPRRGWQGAGHCPRGFGQRITRLPARVGTPGHRRVRWVVLLSPSRHFSIDLVDGCVMCTFILWSHADYYEDSVTLGLASFRPSRVPVVLNVSSAT